MNNIIKCHFLIFLFIENIFKKLFKKEETKIESKVLSFIKKQDLKNNKFINTKFIEFNDNEKDYIKKIMNGYCCTKNLTYPSNFICFNKSDEYSIEYLLEEDLYYNIYKCEDDYYYVEINYGFDTYTYVLDQFIELKKFLKKII